MTNFQKDLYFSNISFLLPCDNVGIFTKGIYNIRKYMYEKPNGFNI